MEQEFEDQPEVETKKEEPEGEQPEPERQPGPEAHGAPLDKRQADFEAMWHNALPLIQRVIPQHMTPEKIFAIAVAARARNPKLLECTSLSVLRSVIIASQLGLDVSGINGQGWLVPFWNSRTKEMEAVFIAGYKGLIDLARRHGDIVAIYSREVWSDEEFQYQDGLVQFLIHRPHIKREIVGEPTVAGAWAVAVFRNGFRQAEVMSGADIEKVRRSSKAADGDAWTNWYPAMSRKSVIRRLCKVLPQSPDLRTYMDYEDTLESGQVIHLPGEEKLLESPKEEPKLTRTEEVKEAVRKRGPRGAYGPRKPKA